MNSWASGGIGFPASSISDPAALGGAAMAPARPLSTRSKYRPSSSMVNCQASLSWGTYPWRRATVAARPALPAVLQRAQERRGVGEVRALGQELAQLEIGVDPGLEDAQQAEDEARPEEDGRVRLVDDGEAGRCSRLGIARAADLARRPPGELAAGAARRLAHHEPEQCLAEDALPQRVVERARRRPVFRLHPGHQGLRRLRRQVVRLLSGGERQGHDVGLGLALGVLHADEDEAGPVPDRDLLHDLGPLHLALPAAEPRPRAKDRGQDGLQRVAVLIEQEIVERTAPDHEGEGGRRLRRARRQRLQGEPVEAVRAQGQRIRRVGDRRERDCGRTAPPGSGP